MFKNQATKTHFFFFLTLWLLIALIMQPVVFAAEGKLVFDKVHSPALEGNLLGDSADRSVIVYLPPSYETSPEKRYPVVYLLHGAGLTNSIWVNDGGYTGNVAKMMDRLIVEGKVREMIVVMPDAFHKYLRSQYANSSVTGLWEDFITQDVVKYIDANYRTLPQIASRGIAGHSMGGAGCLRLSMKHPEIYSAVYAMSSGAALAFASEAGMNRVRNMVLGALDFKPGTGSIPTGISFAAAFSPNPDKPPFFVGFPFEKVGNELKLVESVWKKWLAHDPVELIKFYQSKPQQLRAIQFDCGTSDSFNELNRIFDKALTDAGIRHTYEEYAGDHVSGIRERMETKVLPFFSDVLAFEMLSTVGVKPRGKLAMTWGEVKRK